MQTWLWNKVKIFRREQSTRHRLITTGCLIFVNFKKSILRTLALVSYQCTSCRQFPAAKCIMKSPSLRCYHIISLMPILLSILLLHTHVRYLRSMIPWPAQPVYSVLYIFATPHEGPILILKHTSNLWDLFTGTTYFAHTRLSQYGKPREYPYVRTIVGVWGFPAFSLGDAKRFQASQFSQPRRLDWFCIPNIFRTT